MLEKSNFEEKYSVKEQSNSQGLLEILLHNRGIKMSDKDDFLQPKWDQQHDPFLMHNMDRVVGRLWLAIENNESVVVFSDYDADGVPGAVILTDLFKKIGFENYTVYIPNRNTEGFGLNSDACEKFIDDGFNLVITIDCGIADLTEIKQLQDGGVEVIVTDHHLPSVDGLPNCLILDPKQSDCAYPFDELCGSGVIFKLVQAMIDYGRGGGLPSTREDEQARAGFPAERIAALSVGWEKWLLDMVGIATICDMVPLVGENRIFAHYGLQVLRKSPRPGLQKLLQLGRTDQQIMSAQDVAFTIGPRINAASRIADPMIAFNALSQSGAEGVAAAEELEKLNRKRKTVTAAAAKAAYKKIETAPEGPVIVIGDTEWPLGIVGLIAGNIADRYGKPAFVWTRVGDLYKGSVRSGGSCSIHQLMDMCDDAFESFGGHDAAGGFVCNAVQIHQLQDKLNTAWDKCPSQEIEKKLVEAVISIDEVTKDNWDIIKSLEPYGLGNPKPTFVIEDIALSNVRVFGSDGQHLSLSFRNSRGWIINAIRFNYQDLIEHVPNQDQPLTMVVTFEMNTYNGSSELRLRIEDLFV